MKKTITLFLTVIMVLLFCACGTNNEIKEPQQQNIQESQDTPTPAPTPTPVPEVYSTAQHDNKVTPENEVLSPVPTESQQVSQTINFSDVITLDFVEITINGATTGDEMRPDNPQRVYRYSKDQEGEKYFYTYGTIKNTSGEKYEFADNMYASIIFDGKYRYNANVKADEDGSFSYIYAYLNPLKTEQFYIAASVPDELIETYQQAEIQFGFKENFESKYNIQADECDYLYSITVTK